MTDQSLTPKQEKFAQRYVELGNASEAYRQSYDAENMLDKTIWEAASRTLADCKVAARIMELQEDHRQRHAVTVTKVMDEYRKLAFLDIRKIFDEEGNLIPIHEMDADTAAALSGLEVEKRRPHRPGFPGAVVQKRERQDHHGIEKQLAARGVPSPDYAEGLVLCFAPPPAGFLFGSL